MDNTELRQNCYAMGYSDGEVGAFYDGYEKGKTKTIEEMETIVSEFNDYCDATECLDCWMNSFDKSCLHQWIDKKLEQLKEEHDGR